MRIPCSFIVTNRSGGICAHRAGSPLRFGEGVRAWFNSNMDISENTTFVGNSAIFGGGVSATSSSSVNTNMDGGNATFSIVDIIRNILHSVTSHMETGVCNVTIKHNNRFLLYGAGGGPGFPIFSNGICGVYHYCRRVNSNVKISGNTTFIGNSAVFGGGVSTMSSSSVDICLLITHLVEESMQHPIAV